MDTQPNQNHGYDRPSPVIHIESDPPIAQLILGGVTLVAALGIGIAVGYYLGMNKGGPTPPTV